MTAAHPFLPLIAETLRSTAARHVLRVGELPWPAQAAPAALMLSPDCLDDGQTRPRHELAIACLSPSASAAEARHQIAALRDLLARQLLVFMPESLLDDTSLIALGLSRQAHFEVDGVAWQAWSYDIRTYKSVPDWLNPKYWANPENWNKYRW